MDGQKYDEAIEKASDILLEAMLGDLDDLMEEGRQLDLKVKEVVFALGRCLLVKLYDVCRAVLVEEAKREGKTVQRSPVVTFKPVLGPVEVESPYVYDGEAGEGARPMREQFGIVGEAYSDGADRAISDFGGESSFRDASKRFAEHYGWQPGETTVRNRTQDVAEAAEAYVERRLERARQSYDLPPARRQKTAAEILVEADGCHIRCGKWMPAGQARQQTDDPDELERLASYDDDELVRLIEWKEVRTGLARQFGEVEPTYICSQDDWSEIAGLLAGAACEHHLSFETQVVALGDGAFGLKEAMEMEFAHLQFILDFFHLKEHFYRTGEALMAEGHLVGELDSWVDEHLDTIAGGEAGNVLAELEGLLNTLDPPDDSDEPKTDQTAYGRLERLTKYLTRFYRCVDYDSYKQQGWPIGSGEVESAHKTVPQARLKIAGATWSEENLSSMCALRVLQANDWWDDFWTEEHQRRKAA